MNAKMSKFTVFCAFIVITVLAAGCIFAGGAGGPSNHPGSSPTPSASGTPAPHGTTPTPLPGGYDVSPGGTATPVATPMPTLAPGNNQTNGTHGTPTPSSLVTPSPSPTVTPQPIRSATTDSWGSDKDRYSRGETATGWVYVTNTGNVRIDQVDFTIVIKKTVFFVPVQKVFSYNATSLGIQPGERKKVQFSQTIPSEYSGISTAGDYQLVVTATLAGTEIGSYSRSIKVV